jgi:hypothetical protein
VSWISGALERPVGFANDSFATEFQKQKGEMKMGKGAFIGSRMKTMLSILVVCALWSAAGFCENAPAPSVAKEPGLVAYYGFDEGRGKVIEDLSGNGNKGMIQGDATWIKLTDPFAAQHFGFALKMDSLVNCGRGASLDIKGTGLTLEVWFKTPETNSDIYLLTKCKADWKSDYRGYQLSVIGKDKVRLFLCFGSEYLALNTTAGILKPDTFYHVIATYDGAFAKIYINGVMAASKADTRAIASCIDEPLLMGNFGSAKEHLIDQVKIYSRALSADEINASYAADKQKGQYKVSATPVSGTCSPNLLINTSFKRCSNPGIPDWWGTYVPASIKAWDGCYGIDESMTPPVPGVNCLRIKNPLAEGLRGFPVDSCFTSLPGKNNYTFSIYLKSETAGITFTVEGIGSGVWKASKVFAVTTDWQRYVVNATREDSSPMSSIEVLIKGKGTVWIAAPQLEFGPNATPYRPADIDAVENTEPDPDLLTADCVFLEKPPVIDGKLDEPCWGKVNNLSGFSRNEVQKVPAQVGTDAWIARDAANLYIAFLCHEQDIEKIKAEVKKRDGAVYGDDSVEIFLSTQPEADRYYHFAVNSLGVRTDAFATGLAWNADWQCAVSKGKDYWTVEIAIPFSILNKMPVQAPWRINLCRSRYAGKEPECSSWSHIKSASFHTPNRFAWLTGIGDLSKAIATTPQKITRPLLSAVTEYDFYTSDESVTVCIDWRGNYPADMKMLLKEKRTGNSVKLPVNPVRAAPASSLRIQVPVKGLVEGQYEMKITAVADGKAPTEVSDTFSKLPANAVEVRRNKPGRFLVVDGKPFFTYGQMTCLMWFRYDKKGGGGNYTKNNLGKDNWQLDDIKANGFNSVIVWWDFHITDENVKREECKRFLDECMHKGLKVFFYIGSSSKSGYEKFKESTMATVRQFKYHPAVVAWLYMDEPDIWWEKPGERKESDLVDLYQAIKSIDPYRPAFVNYCHFGNPPYGTLDANDIVSLDRYPLCYDVLKFNPNNVSDIALDINRAAEKVNKPTHMFLQGQGKWNMAREPTPGEVRHMCYVNFIFGTRMIHFFEYKPMSKLLWESEKPLGVELQTIFQYIATPDAHELASSRQGPLFYSLWQSGDNYYLLYANATDKSIQSGINLRELIGKDVNEIKALSENDSADGLSKNRLMLTLRPLQCGAYRLR